ncbi:hypothetical protein AO1008_05419 [Aspergillus oryzae 100-8]|uniref:Uncharacterized protein n=1 Tax=Aspergillus oryzae (strain 3.042) TaxID=1160506 RepID=I8U506_ASPO3|nr:hypothetical protein Ao3042_01691 [Aspergillus oryzae 3.042]KDE79259.1 hypothetical protein AO1008_05419 [Aspergillus oryzae 100-8]|eukprot:EIT81813.1 hypothetical protein Ao3042_01691 [Aspergillus oryzae 3.042]
MEDGAQKFTRRPKALLNDLITHQVDQVEPGVPQLNTNVEVRSQLFQSFIDRYLPQSQYIRDRTGKNILQTLPDLSGSSLLIDKAVVALSTAFLAKQNQDRHLLQNSTKIYGNAIQMLYGKISSGRALGKDVFVLDKMMRPLPQGSFVVNSSSSLGETPSNLLQDAEGTREAFSITC